MSLHTDIAKLVSKHDDLDLAFISELSDLLVRNVSGFNELEFFELAGFDPPAMSEPDLTELFPYTVVLDDRAGDIRTLEVEGLDSFEAVESAAREAQRTDGKTYYEVGYTVCAVIAGHHINLETAHAT